MAKEKYIKFDEAHEIKILIEKFNSLTKKIKPLDDEREAYAQKVLRLVIESDRYKNFIKKKDYEAANLLGQLIPSDSVCRLIFRANLKQIMQHDLEV